jgi:hypothetical protein
MGCDINDPKSVRQFAEAFEARKTNVQKFRERAAFSDSNDSGRRSDRASRSDLDRLLSGELPPAGRRGAAAALARLEETEERAHARLLVAMEKGNPFVIRETQEFWLKCSETLRRLDLAVEIARRDVEERLPKRQAAAVVLYVAEWLRIAFAQFLSAESSNLMALKSLGEFEKYAFERFRGILDLTVKNSAATKSPIPVWAAEKISECWTRPPLSPGPNVAPNAGGNSI